MNALLAKDDFDGARERLDRAGVGPTSAPGPLSDKDLAAARRAFEERIDQWFLAENQRLLQQGKPREARERLAEALRLCPWCVGVKQANTTAATIVSSIDAFGLTVKQAAAGPAGDTATVGSHRALLRAGRSHRAMLHDSPAILSGLELLEAKIAGVWESRIRNDQIKPSDLPLFREDLDLLGVPHEGQHDLETHLRLLLAEQSQLVRERAHNQALLGLVRTRAPRYPPSVSALRQLVASRLGSHVIGGLRRELVGPDVEYSAVAFGEDLLDAARSRAHGLQEIVAHGHLARAQRFAGSGRAAVLALVHLERAQQLGVSSTSPDVTKLRNLATASLAASGRWAIRLRVLTDPSDEPFVQELARFAVTRSIRQRARPHVHIQPVSHHEKDSDVVVAIESVKLFVPSISDLEAIDSTYLSHYEDVPNPVKRVLKGRLDVQRISVDYALSALNNAIAAFNINPTQWTLQSVNGARTRYTMEVDAYNSIVQQYNLASATIPRAVYLPYVYREGTVRHGWRMTGTVRVGSREERFAVEEVDSDFVRLGTRADDRDASRRRDDLLEISVGTERLAKQLGKVTDAVVDTAVGTASWRLRPEVRPDLSAPERNVIAKALYPFRDAREGSATEPAWAKEVVPKLTLPSIMRPTIPILKIPSPRIRPREATPEALASFYGPAVALISSKDGALGSGALISNDGLVLTAAHVLGSEPIAVAFPRSGDTRRYAATLIFVNETHDVALLRVTGYRSDRWFEIGLSDGVAAGEPVVAMGNPSIGAAGTALTAISSGIVAKPYDPNGSEGLAGLVADVGVASGSSGGPLVSRRTGKVIGVVTAVVSPSISKDFATSGYWAVAAPSSQLEKWLGITYGR